MHAYSETYVADAQEAMGVMLDYGTRLCHLNLRDFYNRFLSLPVAEAFGTGHPRFVAGLSGIELGMRVLLQSGHPYKEECNYRFPMDSPETYWAGWFLAYLQWYTGRSFASIDRGGLPIEKIVELFHPLHEADLSKCVEVACTYLKKGSPLKTLRKSVGLSQEELAQQSGVSLRMIRAYEQGTQDLSKAESQTLLHLARALHCRPERLLEG